MAEQYFVVLGFLLMGIAVGGGAMIGSFLFRPFVADPVKRTTYECGMDALGTTEVKTNIHFYLYALLFVVFDVEALFVYPWAVVAKDKGVLALGEMAVFLVILVGGLAYAWGKGALEWE